MADRDESAFPFNIRRLDPTAKPAAPAPEPVPPKAPPKKSESPPAAAATGGRFSSPGGVLAFLNAVAGLRLTEQAECRRSIDGAWWWSAVELTWAQAAELVWAAGGVPYSRRDRAWVFSLSADGQVGGAMADKIDPSNWPEVELADLVAATPFQSAGAAPALDAAEVVLPGTLAQWGLRRALEYGLQVRMASALRRPLRGAGAESGAVLLKLRGEGKRVPGALLHAFARMPYTTVARAAGMEESRLLIDIRCRAPLAETLFARMIPANEVWVLGTPDVGHSRLRVSETDIDGSALVAAPTMANVAAPAAGAVKMPAPLPVRLEPRPGGSSRVDAVLIDDAELAWLRDFLIGRPVGESAFLLPGNGRHLLTAPGGLASAVPFGVPMLRVGPGGLYVESGHAFSPPLPEGARRAAFDLKSGRSVAVTPERIFQFDTAQMLPAWRLWLGPAPPITSGVSGEGAKLLAGLAEYLRQQEAGVKKEEPQPQATRKVERSELLAKAMEAELAGDLVTAASLLESAGELGQAGRLFEKAANKAL